jgi:CheY-like chemotaxis protein
VTSISTIPVSKKVLLFDENHRRRGVRAANLRVRGVEVVTAKDLGEAQLYWHEKCYDLVLLDGESKDVMSFGRELQVSNPSQSLAFFVAEPPYLSRVPGPDIPLVVREAEENSLQQAEEAYRALPQRNGFKEASLRILLLRASKRKTAPAPPMKGEDLPSFLRRVKEQS